MTDFQGWTPPPGEVVAPPVHPETKVLFMWSDGVRDDQPRLAGSQNWSAEGDGPRVVAYAVVEEYKPAPREFWIVDECEAYDSLEEAQAGLSQIRSTKQAIIHVREVLPGAREVVAWAVVTHGHARELCFHEVSARASLTARTGGTVIKLTGVMP